MPKYQSALGTLLPPGKPSFSTHGDMHIMAVWATLFFGSLPLMRAPCMETKSETQA